MTNSLESQSNTVNAYLLRAVTNIIVPEGLDNIAVRVGNGTVVVATTASDNQYEIKNESKNESSHEVEEEII